MQMTLDSTSFRTIVAELRPLIEAIAASRRQGRKFAGRDVFVALPGSAGETVVVSVRPAKARRVDPISAPARGLDERQLRLVYQAIDERIGEPISVSMLSSVAGLSRSHFSHAFRKSVGRTPHEHVVRTRIERAMELMTEKNTPLSAVALAVGFYDQAHFANTFRRTVGMTPKQWRNQTPALAAQANLPVTFSRARQASAPY